MFRGFGGKGRPRHKFGAKKVTIDGFTFDSTKEANRYVELRLLVKHGRISNLELQPFFKWRNYHRREDGVEIVGRSERYTADFKYIEHGKVVYEDVKGMRLTEYLRKKKIVEALFGVTIVEI